MTRADGRRASASPELGGWPGEEPCAPSGVRIAFPSGLVLRAGAAQRVCNLFISNGPGPQQPLYMAGALNVHSVGMAPLADGMGLFIGTPSYNGEITFNVTSTRHILPDIDFFVECLRQSLGELKAAAEAPPAPKKKKRKKKAAAS